MSRRETWAGAYPASPPTQWSGSSLARRERPNFVEMPSSNITIGPIRFDTARGEVSVDGKTTSLTAMESVVLYFLAVNANHVCTDNQIGSYIWRVNNVENSSLLKVYIRHLRYKIEPDPSNPTYILTIPGVGYMLVSHDLDEAMQKTSANELQ